MKRPYYSRHNLPQKRPNRISIATQINRNFYQSLRKRGRTHTEVMNLIQPERYQQFLKDVLPLVPETTYGKKKPKLSFWGRLVNFF